MEPINLNGLVDIRSIVQYLDYIINNNNLNTCYYTREYKTE